MTEKNTNTAKGKTDKKLGIQGRMDPVEPSGPHHGNPATAGPGGGHRTVNSSTPENAEGRINPSAPTESTEQGALNSNSQATENAGRGAMGYGGSKKPQSASGSLQDAGRTIQKHPQQQSRQNQKKSFRCADAGYAQCHWQVEGTEDEILPQIEQHAKDTHHIDFKPASREEVRSLMKDAA